MKYLGNSGKLDVALQSLHDRIHPPDRPGAESAMVIRGIFRTTLSLLEFL